MAVNPLIEIIHERRIERPESFTHHPKYRNATNQDWHPVAAAVAKLGSLLCQYGHRWNKGEKKLYRRAILSARHPCCPTCGDPMNESALIIDGVTHKSWYCETHPNF